ncbi:ABZJ_00895 family protein [Vibrio gazogenes]|nr:ABZJ_00895 family protein [Vibrio gazogenes]
MMTKVGFFIRFTVTYIVIIAIAGVSASLLGMENASNLNTPILFGISYWVFYSYTNKNQRIIEKQEKWHLILLALLGDVITTILLGTPTMLANHIPLHFLLVGLLISIPLHFLLFLAVNFGVKKMMLKQNPKLSNHEQAS